MKILFFISHDGSIRNFEPFLHALAARGDRVHLAASTRRVALMSEARSLDDLCASEPNITYGIVPKPVDKGGRNLMRVLAASRSYLRFLTPEYENAPKLRSRAEGYVPPRVLRLLKTRALRSSPGRWVLDRFFVSAISTLPTEPELDEFIRGQAPDAVLFTPLIYLRDVGQLSALRSAKQAGIPTALLVHSWDNLTNKGLIHEIPDAVVVWNDAQKREAVDLHDIPEERVVVTGAHSYDNWFDWRPSTTREEFCRRVGLDPRRPYLLYMCSSTFIAPDEVPFVRRWIASLRASQDERLRDIGILVRPHPQNVDAWRGLGPERLGGAVVHPRPGASRAGRESRVEYFDSIHHCAAVVGVNTSALIESAIQERPVLTWLVPEFRDTQEGTLHFQHIGADDGLLLVATSFDEHEAQLAGVLASPDAAARSRRFVEAFVRPYGADVAGTPRLVDAVDALAAGCASAKRVRPRGTALVAWAARLCLFLWQLRFRRRRVAAGLYRRTAGVAALLRLPRFAAARRRAAEGREAWVANRTVGTARPERKKPRRAETRPAFPAASPPQPQSTATRATGVLEPPRTKPGADDKPGKGVSWDEKDRFYRERLRLLREKEARDEAARRRRDERKREKEDTAAARKELWVKKD